MKKIKNKVKVLILAMVLFVVSLLWICINGRTYTVILNVGDKIASIDELEFKIGENIKCTEKQLENGILKLKFKSIAKGKSFVEIYNNKENFSFFSMYVHKLMIMTYNNYFGDLNGGKRVPISSAILLSYILYLSI